MFFKIISLSTALVLLVVYVNIDTHESPILLPPKNEIQKEVEQVLPQQKEYTPVKNEFESYITTSIGKTCLSSNIHASYKQEMEASITSPVSVSDEDVSSLQNYLDHKKQDNSGSIEDIGKSPTLRNGHFRERNDLVLISPFAKEAP